VVDLRDADADDLGFLTQMLAVAADWRPGVRGRTTAEILRQPEFAHYVVGWPRPGDCGVVAQLAGEPVGAAWFRFLPSSDRGYGYVADDVPEITIGVREGRRGVGIGSALMRRLVERARSANVGVVSLSVEEDNPAMRLYERVGFIAANRVDGAATMILRLER
jgi:ribosomal protein S18 acetylase RimI-like enzyme